VIDRLADRIIAKQAVKETQADVGEDRLLNARDAAEFLGVSRAWLYKNSGKLPFARKVGGALRFDRRQMKRWLESRRKV
jgi:excisionase family DNA binding protein